MVCVTHMRVQTHAGTHMHTHTYVHVQTRAVCTEFLQQPVKLGEERSPRSTVPIFVRSDLLLEAVVAEPRQFTRM